MYIYTNTHVLYILIHPLTNKWNCSHSQVGYSMTMQVQTTLSALNGSCTGFPGSTTSRTRRISRSLPISLLRWQMLTVRQIPLILQKHKRIRMVLSILARSFRWNILFKNFEAKSEQIQAIIFTSWQSIKCWFLVRSTAMNLNKSGKTSHGLEISQVLGDADRVYGLVVRKSLSNWMWPRCHFPCFSWNVYALWFMCEALTADA